MLNETCQLTWKTPHNDGRRSLARTIELRIVSCNNRGSETKAGAGKKEKKRHQFYSELFSLERCLLSVTSRCDCWKTHRNCKPQIPSCPSASHNILLCVAQAEIQSAWEADEWFGAQLWSERYWVSPGRYPLCRLCEQTKQLLFWGNLVMHLLYKKKMYLCLVAVWCRSQDDDNRGKNMKGIRKAQCVLPFHM